MWGHGALQISEHLWENPRKPRLVPSVSSKHMELLLEYGFVPSQMSWIRMSLLQIIHYNWLLWHVCTLPWETCFCCMKLAVWSCTLLICLLEPLSRINCLNRVGYCIRLQSTSFTSSTSPGPILESSKHYQCLSVTRPELGCRMSQYLDVLKATKNTQLH